MRYPLRLPTLALLLSALAPSAVSQASFTGLGFAPGAPSSGALGVNAAGDVVVGSSGGPVYWEDGLLVPLGGEGIPYGVSADGDVIVGWDHIHPNDSEAVRWVDGAFERLGDLPGGGFSSHAWDVSANG